MTRCDRDKFVREKDHPVIGRRSLPPNAACVKKTRFTRREPSRPAKSWHDPGTDVGSNIRLSPRPSPGISADTPWPPQRGTDPAAAAEAVEGARGRPGGRRPPIRFKTSDSIFRCVPLHGLAAGVFQGTTGQRSTVDRRPRQRPSDRDRDGGRALLGDPDLAGDPNGRDRDLRAGGRASGRSRPSPRARPSRRRRPGSRALADTPGRRRSRRRRPDEAGSSAIARAPRSRPAPRRAGPGPNATSSNATRPSTRAERFAGPPQSGISQRSTEAETFPRRSVASSITGARNARIDRATSASIAASVIAEPGRSTSEAPLTSSSEIAGGNFGPIRR